MPGQEIIEMVVFAVVNESCCVLEEGIFVRASDLDTAFVLGMSFSSYRYTFISGSKFFAHRRLLVYFSVAVVSC